MSNSVIFACTGVGLSLIGIALTIYNRRRTLKLKSAADSLQKRANENKRVGILSSTISTTKDKARSQMDKTVLLLISSTGV